MPIKLQGNARAKFVRLGAQLPGAARAGVAESARVVRAEILRGAPARLRGVGKRGAALGVRYDIQGRENPTALVRATGPWQLIEGDTRAHDIRPKAARVRGGKRVAVLTPGGPRRVAHSRGTRGKHPWAKGVARAAPLATRAFEARVIEQVRKTF